jgi:hypothetical protein
MRDTPESLLLDCNTVWEEERKPLNLSTKATIQEDTKSGGTKAAGSGMKTEFYRSSDGDLWALVGRSDRVLVVEIWTKYAWG